MPEEAVFDFPIVELENDSPQGIGKSGLFDFSMPVGNTGIVFVAALQGILYAWGPQFSDLAKQAAYRRAASTLAQWGIVSNDTFAFIALGVPMDAQGIATRYGVPLATAQGWLNGTIPVPAQVWQCFAHLVCATDQRNFLPNPPSPVPPPSLRPRTIRVFPNVPTPSMPQPPAAPPCPPPPRNPCG